MNRRIFTACLAATLMLTPCFGAEKGLEKQLLASVKGNVYWLAKPYSSDKLEFDSSGQLAGDAETGSPAMSGLVRIAGLSLNNDTLRVTGWRALAVYSPGPQTFALFPTEESIHVTIHLSHPVSDEAEAQVIWAQVFSGGNPNQRLAGYWKPTLDHDKDVKAILCEDHKAAIGLLDGRQVYCTNCGTPPRMTRPHRPDHQLSAVGLSGQANIRMLIDERGKPVLMMADDPQDRLQSELLSNFSGSLFSPGTKDGKPVPVYMNLEIGFKSPK
jgi:hypothetical protein